jgi:hypothetical protein
MHFYSGVDTGARHIPFLHHSVEHDEQVEVERTEFHFRRGRGHCSLDAQSTCMNEDNAFASYNCKPYVGSIGAVRVELTIETKHV